MRKTFAVSIVIAVVMGIIAFSGCGTGQTYKCGPGNATGTCTATGTFCVWTGANTYACQAAGSPAPYGSTCDGTNITSCGLGLWCVYLTAGGTATCQTPCNPIYVYTECLPGMQCSDINGQGQTVCIPL